jgi:hypothetical protein
VVIKRAIVLLAMLAATAAFGQQDYPRDITLSWVNASEYVDGTQIESGDLTSVRIECFRQNETTPVVNQVVAAIGEGAAQTVTFAGVIPNPGTYTCYGYSVVVGNIESDASNPSSKKYVGKPVPPATWTIEG